MTNKTQYLSKYITKAKPSIRSYDPKKYKIANNSNKYNAYITQIDNRPQSNNNSNKSVNKLLNDIPIAVKDNFCIKDIKTTAGSKMLSNYIPTYNATIIDRLLDNNVNILYKTNMDEFGMGTHSLNELYGTVKNPINMNYSAGGSSGGSAVSVANGDVLAAIGSDTGGSIRLPASYCGIIGFKPSYGALSRYGLIAYASSFDTPGIFTNYIDDCQIIFKSMIGKDNKDDTSIDILTENHQIESENKTITIGIPKEFYIKELSDQILNIWKTCAIHLNNYDNINVIEVDLPLMKYVLPTYYILTCAEASSNLSRYDGLRYGYNHQSINDYHDLISFYTDNRTYGFNEEVKRRIMLGTFVLSSEAYNDYIKRAQIMRQMIKNQFESIFQQVNFLLTPTSSTSSLSFDQILNQNPIETYLTDLMTVPANLCGIPAINIPMDQNKQTNMPYGLQVMAPYKHDFQLLNFTKKYFHP